MVKFLTPICDIPKSILVHIKLKNIENFKFNKKMPRQYKKNLKNTKNNNWLSTKVS